MIQFAQSPQSAKRHANIIRHRQHPGWIVRIGHEGRTHTRYFSDKKNGGPKHALAGAIAWRNGVRAALGLPTLDDAIPLDAGDTPRPGRTSKDTELTGRIQKLEKRQRELEEQLREREEWIELLEHELEQKETAIREVERRAMANATAILAAAAPRLPELEPVPNAPDPNTLEEVADRVEQELATRVLLTRRARRELRRAPFEDASRAWGAFRMLANEVYQHLAGEMSVEELSARLGAEGITYAPFMHEITLTRYADYNARWKGRPADMNKHLRIGSSRNQARCLRIHFEWDEEERKIIVHHAGRHLTTTFT